MKIVIFCGGYGTRMWPASRKSYPKQFFPMLSGKSFFQNTVARFKKAYDPKDIIVATEQRYEHFIHEQAPEIPPENIILEPERRDNLAAIGLSAFLLEKRFPGEVIFFSWSDHIIEKERTFLKYVKIASDYCFAEGHPVSLDQRPQSPSTHLGWLQMGDVMKSTEEYKIYEIEKHIEKPNLQTAKKLFNSRKYVLHTGYGAWRSDILVGFYEKYNTIAYKHLKKIADAWGTTSYETVLKKEYGKIPKDSIDYGLFEKIPHNIRYTIPVDFGWKDVGTWQLMFESFANGPEDNLAEGQGKTMFIESEGNLVISPKGKMISIIGLSNIAVIDTPDGLLVSALDKTSHVKDLFGILEKDDPDFVK